MSGNQSGENWDWKRSENTGYAYPTDAHLMTVNRGARNPGDIEPWPRRTPPPHPLAGFKVAVALTAAATIATVGGGVLVTAAPAEMAADPVAITTTATEVGNWPGNFTAPTTTLANPYTDTGDWRVGVDLPAGLYRVTVTGDVGGYFARCADTVCAIGAGLILNAVLSPGDSTVLHIAPTDHMVRTAGVELTPA